LSRHAVGFVGGGQVARAHFIGFGNVPLLFGPTHTAELKTVAEATDRLAKDAARRFGIPRWTSDWRKVTGDPAVDIVDVMTPTGLHKAPSVDAIEHGKSVICEKPLASNERDAREMHERAEKAGALTAVGFNYRRIPAVALAKQMVSSGEIGKVYHMKSDFMEDWGGKQFPLTWRFRPEDAGAGVLADLGSHALDMVRYLAGEPMEVCGVATNFVKERNDPETKVRKPSRVDDVALAMLKLKGGAVAEVGASWVASGRKVQLEFEVQGSEGTIHFTMERPNELDYYAGGDREDRRGFRTIYFGPKHPYGETLIFGAPAMGTGYVDSITNQMRDFLAAMDEGGTYSPSFYDGWKANLLIEAILKSTEKKAWVSVG
jgi:predicted dehydrogenase